MSERTQRLLSRRNFILAVGAGGVATAAAVLTSKKSSPVTSGKGRRAARGYHSTEHINNYYRTAKV